MTDFTLSWGTRPAHRPTAPRRSPDRAPLACPTLPRLTANRWAASRCNRVADNGLYFSLGTRPARRLRLTAPRPLIQPRRRSLAPLPHPTANRLTAPRRNRVADDGLYSFVGYEARASPDCTAPLARPRSARLSPLPRLTANRLTAPLACTFAAIVVYYICVVLLIWGRTWFRRGSWKPDKRAEAPCFVKNGTVKQ